jgi:hypothetical protein
MFKIMTTSKNTRIYRSFHGWIAETNENVNGQDWKITTNKGYSGKITSTAQSGTKTDMGFSFEMFGKDKSITLVSEKARATEKSIREQHAKALILFDENEEVQKRSDKKAAYTIEVGQVVWGIGYAMNDDIDSRAAIYEIEETKWGTVYHTVNLQNLRLSRVDRIRDIEEKFGIGTYYEKGDIIEAEELTNLVIEAKEKEAKEARKAESEKLLAQAERAAKIEEGQQIVNIPAWAKCVIVAEMYQNDSDSMTDYFSTSVSKTVYLAFSRTTRNNMQELRKAAANFEETKEFTEGGEEIEHTRDHSYLPDYFLGTERWYGWKVNKRKYIDLTKEETKELLYIAAAEGRYFVPTQEESTQTEQAEEITGDISLINYSDKAIAVYGDTKPVKDTLKALGGRFNFRLTHPETGNKLAGWIFPKTKTNEVRQALNL